MDPDTLRKGELAGRTIDFAYVGWQLCDRLSIKPRFNYSSAGETKEHHDVYDAFLTWIKPEEADKVHQPPLTLGMPAIIKVRKQVETWSKNPDSSECSNEINTEIHNLKVLTEAGCQHTPRLIDYSVELQGDDDIFPGGYIAYIVMEKVPGKDLSEYDEMERSEQRCVQLAFLEAIWSFRKCQMWHWDPRLQNLIWDPEGKKCYIVDFEDVEHDTELSADGFTMNPSVELMKWKLIKEIDHPFLRNVGKEELIEYWREHMDEQDQMGKQEHTDEQDQMGKQEHTDEQ